jgi:hypothetical protein
MIVGAGSGSTTISAGASSALDVRQGASISISGMTISGNSGVSSSNGSQVNILSDIIIGACTNSHLYALNGKIIIFNSYSYSGNSAAHYSISQYGTVVFAASSITVTCIGSVTFSQAFCLANAGEWNYGGATLTFANAGSVTGQRYLSTFGGVINTNGGGSNFFPGTVAGSVGSSTATGFYG